ncbi:hypothetical protein AWB73_05350 [Caballeronia turbans]|nr:hypothetical protein AWB73_05350 [Caballeronia turbans]
MLPIVKSFVILIVCAADLSENGKEFLKFLRLQLQQETKQIEKLLNQR